MATPDEQDSERGPRLISDRASEIDVTGYLVPSNGQGPVLLQMPGTTAQYLPIFSTIEKLKQALAAYDIPYIETKVISDSQEFLQSLPPTVDGTTQDGEAITTELRLIVDPYKHENGRLRFIEVLRDN